MTEPKVLLMLLMTSIAAFLSPGMYGVLGSMGFYAHEILQEKDTFKWITLLLYIFLGFVIAVMVHDLVIHTIQVSYSGLLVASGFSVRKIASVANKFLGITNILK